MKLLRRWWWLLPPMLLMTIVWPERHFVSIWDGNVYLQCVVEASAHGLNAHSLRCGGHQSQLYMGLLALAERTAPGSTVPIVIMNLVLAAGALVAFGVLLQRLAPGDDWWGERALLVTVLAVHPLISATLVQVNPDFGLYVFFLITLAFLVWRCYWWAAIAGLMLCFSKETGALAFGVMLGLHTLFRVVDDGWPASARWRVLAREIAPAALPIIAYAGFLVWWGASQSGYVIWSLGVHQRPLTGLHWFDFDDVILRSYAAIIFVLGFAWVAVAAIAVDLSIGAHRTVSRRPDRGLGGLDTQVAWFVIALFAVLTYVLTVYRTWSFPRYFAALAPLLIVVSFISVVRIGAAPAVRRMLLAAFGIVLFSANWSSWDPVSKWLFGELRVGDRSLYQVSGIAHDFRVRAADHLCYNLEFTGFHHALDSAFAAIRPTDSMYIVFSQYNRWGMWAPLDRKTFARVVRSTDVVTPRYADETMIAVLRDRKPRDLWLIEQPNDADTSALQALHRDYADASSAQYSARGITIAVRHLVLRTVGVLP